MEAPNPRKGGVVPAPRKYPDELRDRAILLVMEWSRTQAVRPSTPRAYASVTSPASTATRCATGSSRRAPRRDGARGHDPGRGPDGGTAPGRSRAAMSIRDAQERFGFLRGGARPPLHLLIRYIDRHKDLHGVEPICRALTEAGAKIAPSMRACNVAGAVRGRVKRT